MKNQRISGVSKETYRVYDENGELKRIIEKAEESFDQEEAEKLTKQLAKKEFDLNDYLLQLRQVKKMGSFSSILKMIPGMNKIKDLQKLKRW